MRVRALAAGAVFLGLGALMAACSETTKVLPAVGSVTVSPDLVSLQTGETAQLTATVLDEVGKPITRTVTWSSSEPAKATVDKTGLVTAVDTGAVTITATVDTKSGAAEVSVGLPVAAVAVSASVTELGVGDTVTLTALVTDVAGNPLGYEVTWTSSDERIATVDSKGVLTASGTGTVTISATSHGKSGQTTVKVGAAAASIQITGTANEPLATGATRQLGAIVFDASGNPLPNRKVSWASADPSIATVDNTGLVTGVARGDVTITASTGKVSATTSIKVTGGGETTTELGNNLSWPVVFAEGYGITGLRLTTGLAGDTATGIRPLTAEGITVDALPFWNDANTSDFSLNGTTYFLQQTGATWQAQWTNGAASGPVSAQVDWGDNLVGHTFSTAAPIRVEVALYDYAGAQLQGYNMTVLYGSGTTEMQGTDGSTTAFMPLIYAVTPHLVVEKLPNSTAQSGTVVADLPLAAAFGTTEGASTSASESSAKFAAEVNVGGKIVYGYNLRTADLAAAAGVTADGWWRVTFELDQSTTVNGVTVNRNVTLDQLAPSESELLYPPQLDKAGNRSWVTFYVEPK